MIFNFFNRRGHRERREMNTNYLYKELTGQIISAAIEVLDTLKPGLDEKIYENALSFELRKRGHNVTQQKSFPVFYKNEKMGSLIPDLIIDDKVIADPKVVSTFNDSHIAQMIGYLSITNLKVALLLNFKYKKLTTKRIVREYF